MLRLQLFGGVAWQGGDQVVDVEGTTRADVLLTLVANQGSPVSVEHLLDRLWNERPTSGANAVQRHISALRRQLGSLVAKPTEIIERVPGGYRLAASVVTDITDLEGTGELACWWEQPLLGVDPEHHAILHGHLQRLAMEAFEAWQLDPGVTPELAVRRAEHMQNHTPNHPALRATLTQAAKHRRDETVGCITLEGRRALRSCIGLWSAGRGDEALDHLDAAEGLPPDFARRLCRWLIWFAPEDPWARFTFSLLVREVMVSPTMMERNLVTIDGRCFELMTDGRNLARRETEAMATTKLRVRALRVEFLLGLSSPHDQRQSDVLAALSTIDHPDAIVEAQRFRFLSRLRTGRFGDAVDELDAYSQIVRSVWPGSGDDFGPMARAALQRSIDKRVVDVFGDPTPSIGAFADEKVIPLAETLSRLLKNSPAEPFSELQFFDAVSGITPEAGQALTLLRDLRAGRDVQVTAAEIARQLPTQVRDKQFHLTPVALIEVAEATGQRSLATAAHTALQPWRAQTLGLWPIDFIFGPADDWISRAETI